MIAKVISGGQTGVDIAALRAAKRLGIPTGGTMPAGWRTLDGPKPEWAAEFGLSQHKSSDYAPRTYENVRDSDITVRIAVDFESMGERCTARAIRQHGRPSVDVAMLGRPFAIQIGAVARAAEAIKAESARLGRPVVVNFAGNSEKTAPGIERAAEEIVYEILRRCQR